MLTHRVLSFNELTQLVSFNISFSITTINVANTYNSSSALQNALISESMHLLSAVTNFEASDKHVINRCAMRSTTPSLWRFDFPLSRS